MNTGLVLGKFAPLHKGHQYLIETSLSENEKTIVLIYDSPEVIAVPLRTRTAWIERLYPKVEVIEVVGAPSEVGSSPELTRKHEDVVIRALKGQAVNAFYSSEFYGEHMSRALGAVDRRIDSCRKKFPVSATKIRQNPLQYKEYVHPLVYRDLVANICLLGAPSTGKSTLTAALGKKYHTAIMHEHGRDYWEKNQVNRRLSKEQLLELAQQHLILEEQALLCADRYLFTDTCAITTLLFSEYYHGDAHEGLKVLAHQAVKRYSLFVLCADDIPYDNTWDRSGEANRAEFQSAQIAWLEEFRVPYLIARGDIQQRVAKVSEALPSVDLLRPALQILG